MEQFTDTELTDLALALENYQTLWADYERECRNRHDSEGIEKARQYYRELGDLRRKVRQSRKYSPIV